MKNKIDLKGLHIVIEKELHAEIKSRAAFKCIPLREYVIQALADKIAREDQYMKGNNEAD